MENIEFESPDFLKNQSVNEIQQNMMNNLPDDIDKSEGQYPWMFTVPTAIEKSQMVQFQLVELLKLAFPQFSYGNFLDLHGQTKGITRNSATHAAGLITITGKEGTYIKSGVQFGTEATDTTSNIIFNTTEDGTIPATGSVDVAVKANEAGAEGNVMKNTITLMVNPIKGITSITNSDNLTGGTEEESDEDYRNRILEYDATQGSSFVGNISDYERWATDGTGVRSVIITPPSDDTGTIEIALLENTDGEAIPNSNPEPYKTRVINKIMSPDNPEERLAPINAQINVIGTTAVNIYIKANVETDGTKTVAQISSDFVSKIKDYYQTAIVQGEVKYSVIGSLLSITSGVYDYTNLLIKKDSGAYSTSNITLTTHESPITNSESVVLTETW